VPEEVRDERVDLLELSVVKVVPEEVRVDLLLLVEREDLKNEL
jgi:hypothetical protein